MHENGSRNGGGGGGGGIDDESIQPPAALYHACGAPLFFAAAYGANEVGAFDIYSGECRELFRVRAPPPIEAAAAASASASTSTTSADALRRQNTFGGGATAAGAGASSKRASVQIRDAPTGGMASMMGAAMNTPFAIPTLKAFNNLRVLRAPLDDAFLRDVHTACEQFAVDRPSINGFLCCPVRSGVFFLSLFSLFIHVFIQRILCHEVPHSPIL